MEKKLSQLMQFKMAWTANGYKIIWVIIGFILIFLYMVNQEIAFRTAFLALAMIAIKYLQSYLSFPEIPASVSTPSFPVMIALSRRVRSYASQSLFCFRRVMFTIKRIINSPLHYGFRFNLKTILPDYPTQSRMVSVIHHGQFRNRDSPINIILNYPFSVKCISYLYIFLIHILIITSCSTGVKYE